MEVLLSLEELAQVSQLSLGFGIPSVPAEAVQMLKADRLMKWWPRRVCL